jgi:aldose 1-epimerase
MEQSCTPRSFGADGTLYTLTHGVLKVQVTTYGATLVSVHTPDREGEVANIIIGFDNFAAYQGNHPYFGAIVGPCANRIGQASFVLDGKEYKIEPNDGQHALHGGSVGFSRRHWHAERRPNERGPSVTMTLETMEGEGGFPGSVLVSVTYTLTEDALAIEYSGETTKPTVLNLSSHPYWNLRGAGHGDILDHILQISADCYTPTNQFLIPTGQILGVHETALDFTRPRTICSRMYASEAIAGGGYDHNFVLRGGIDGAMAPAAVLHERKTGRQMEIWTTQPGLQLYTGGGLDGSLRGTDGPFVKYGGVCLETQHWPDAVNHENFGSVILRPGESYRQSTLHKFSVVS